MTDFATLVLASDTTGLTNAQRELRGLTVQGGVAEQRLGRATTMMSAGFTRMAGMAGMMGGALAAAFSARAVISGIRDFEGSMSRVAAITRATDAELAQLRATAMDLGITTEFSAGQAADGLAFLGMAGFTAAESISAIPAVLDLATASGMGLAQAADTASNIMSGFGIEAGNAAEVADVLAAASSRANTDVGQLGQAMSTVAPISAALGVDLADTAAAIGVLSDAGIQGERAGTALRGVMASLAGPTNQAQLALARYGLTAADVDPAARSLADVMETLQDAGISTADAMQIFGREAASGALVLSGAAGRIREFGDELRDVDGAAMDMADTMRDNLQGDIQGLGSAVSGLILSLGDAGVGGALRTVVQRITAFVRSTSLLISQVADMIGAFRRLYSEQARIEAQIDNTRTAINDEVRALANLAPAMADGATMSVDMARYKLNEAMSRRENIKAIIDEQRALAMQTSEYIDLSQEIDYVALQSRNLQNTEFDGGSLAPQANREDIEYQLRQLSDLAGARARLLDPSGDATQVLEDNNRIIDELTRGLADAVDGVVTFQGVSLNTVEATERLDTALRDVGGSAGAAAAAADQLTEAQQRALAVIAEMNSDAVTQADVIGALGVMFQSGAIDAVQYAEAVRRVRAEVGDLEGASFDVGKSLSGVFTDAITGAKSLQDGVKGLLGSMADLFLNRAFTALLDGFLPSSAGVGSIFGGARAMGGPVSAGRTYLVGERGPELFTPQGGGQIVPNHQLGAGGGQTVQIINMGPPETVREAGRSKGPDGSEIVKVIVGEELGRGGFNKQMNGLYGVSPTKVRR